jgi:DNA-binding transcriptional LysR family regulator
MVDFKQIEAFVWVAELGSFRAAAEKLHTTQPAISQRIAAMEAVMAVRLFDRGTRGIKLTEKGQELLSHARRILDMRNDMLCAAKQTNAMRGTLRMGVAETLVHTWLPYLIEKLHELYPALLVEIHVDTSQVLRTQLGSHQIDLALLVGVSQDPREQHLHLCDYGLAWVASPGLKLSRKRLTLSELGAYPVITYPTLSLPHQAVRAALQGAGIKEPRIFGSASLSTIVHMARHGMGPCVIACEVIPEELQQGKLRVLDVDCTLPDISFHACWMDSPDSHSVATVARLAQEIATKYNKQS